MRIFHVGLLFAIHLYFLTFITTVFTNKHPRAFSFLDDTCILIWNGVFGIGMVSFYWGGVFGVSFNKLSHELLLIAFSG